ncbi:MAG: hydroxymethylbilane synthase [Anaerolineae bacterium]|nr:MAG: hydroxymethylbilane synthase [Anaerolineae bacterium]
MTLRFATRPSNLARTQTSFVAATLSAAIADLQTSETVIRTTGDRVLDRPLPEIGGKGLFTLELEQALRASTVDVAVHSLKDLPVEDAPGLTLGAIPLRARAEDVLISSSGKGLDELPLGATVGTSSLRRQAQLLAYRPDLQPVSIRGNVDTRIRKVHEGEFDAILLAAAGVTRLGLAETITQYLPLAIMLPAPGQGALAVQCRAEDIETLSLLAYIDHAPTRLAVQAERAFLQALGGGCSLPVAAYAEYAEGELTLRVCIVSVDGVRTIQLTACGAEPLALGASLAAEALALGAGEVLYV